ncbi:HTH domain-containing protein [Staphylococcus canis]|uniref:HTH domain-containing protein n=1 Tax=Staphylococcus canis TaxID=2724942 RepID=A0ABS0TBD5_9STAP|nr:HTH domain-containing protein [Staphylococcus canis]MBI5976044.1 HTH domain-containing protein [Staphylococcus canis]
MSRSNRLLSVYTRLIKNQYINISQLAYEFNVSERTIKRDIQEVRNYLYDNDEWLDRKEVVFNYKQNVYYIPENQDQLKKKDFELLIIFIKLCGFPVQKSIIKLLKIFVTRDFAPSKSALLKLIDSVEAIEYSFEDYDLFKIYKGIYHSQYLRITTESSKSLLIMPLKIVMLSGKIMLIYLFEGREHFVSLKNIKHITAIKNHHKS